MSTTLYTAPSSYEIQHAEPDRESAGQISMVKLQPLSGTTATPGQNVTLLSVNSNNFLDLDKSYITFDVTLQPTGSTTTANFITPTGATCFFQNVIETLGSQILPPLLDYPLLKAIENATASKSRKEFITKTEGYSVATVTSNTSGVSCSSGNAVRFQIPVPCQAISSNSLLPLAFLNGGYKLDILTNQFSNCFGYAASATAGSTYTLSNIALMQALVKPPDEVIRRYLEKLTNDEFIYFPMEGVRNFSLPTNMGTSVVLNTPINFNQSVDQITVTYRKTANITGGLAYCTSTDTLSSWQYNMNQINYPQNHFISAEGATPVSQENLLQTIRTYSTLLDSKSPYVAAYSGYSTFGFKSGGFMSGAPSNNSSFVWNATYSTTTAAGDMSNVWVTYGLAARIGLSGTNLSF